MLFYYYKQLVTLNYTTQQAITICADNLFYNQGSAS